LAGQRSLVTLLLRMTAEATIQRLSCSLVLIAAIAAHAIAQNPVLAGAVVPRTIDVGLHGFWIELGAGVGKSVDAGGNADVSASLEWQQGTTLLSVRGDGVSTGFSSALGQLAFMVGKASTETGGRFTAASAGIAFTQSSVCITNCGLFSDGNTARKTRNTIGATGALKGALRGGSRGGVGIGLTMFVNVNSISSFGGVAVSLSGGRWR
jgi:hypothetical protein